MREDELDLLSLFAKFIPDRLDVTRNEKIVSIDIEFAGERDAKEFFRAIQTNHPANWSDKKYWVFEIKTELSGSRFCVYVSEDFDRDRIRS